MSEKKKTKWKIIGEGTRPGYSLCECQCEHKTQREVSTNNVKYNLSLSCGKCVWGKHCIKHGMMDTVEYRAWTSMKSRCYDPNNGDYHNYGGRGIAVCERWLGKDGFVNFYADMGKRPSDTHSLDRYPDNNGNYEPTNCRWATKSEQARGTRYTRMIEYDGRTQCLQAWADEYTIEANVLASRLNSGWDFEDAATQDVYRNNLNAGEIEYILRKYIKGSVHWGAEALAEKFEVSSQTIQRLVARKIKKYNKIIEEQGLDK